MIRLLALLFLFINLNTAAAQEPEKNFNKKEDQPVFYEKTTDSQQKQSAWPLPFQPSQEIGADSQVSFPTDI